MSRAIAIATVLLVALLGSLWAFQRRLVYFPDREVPLAPAGVEEVGFTTSDGLDLGAWWVPAAGDQRGTVIVFPGNAGNRADRMPLAWGLSAMGYATLLVDYRGYGGNPGSPSEEGLAIDARAALAHVESRDDVNADRIAYFGESLGASVAVLLAVERPPSALIFRSPFTSLADVGSVQLPLLPVSLLLRDRFDSSAKIADIRVPVLIVAGNDDALVSGTDESRPLRARDSAEGVRRNRRCRPQRSGASERDLLLGAVDRHLSDAFG